MTDLMNELSEAARQKAKKKAMPDWMDPMLAKLTHDYFSGDDWIFERKLDGERVLSFISDDGKVTLYSRNKKVINDSYPKIQEALNQYVVQGCILDGEMVAFDDKNVSDFQKLQPRMQVSSRKEAMESDVDVYYYIFDLMYVDGHDVTQCMLRDRKKLLRKAIKAEDPLRFVQYRNDDGLAFYKEACKKGWEGLIAKHADSKYAHQRSKNWLKFKCIMQQEFVIGGYTEPHGERVGFGALLLGFYRDKDLVYAGKVGTGFDDQILQDLHGKLKQIERKTSPYDQDDVNEKEVHYVSPELVCEIAFSEWTANDRLRHPRFKGLRREKSAKEVHKEQESQVTELEQEEET